MDTKGIGRKFEKLFAKIFGGKQVKGSGNRWYAKLDVSGRDLLFSLKATSNESYRVTKKDLAEAFEAVKGPGGLGGDYCEVLAICFVQGDEPAKTDPMYALIDMHDLVRLLEEKRELFLEPKNKQKYRSAEIPALKRRQIKKEGDP